MTRYLRPLFFALALFGMNLVSAADPAPPADSSVRVRIETNLGPMVIKLNPDKAPQTVANFLRYVDEGFYEETIFHRVIPDFMIQGGGFSAQYEKKKTHDAIPNEANNGLKNLRGTIAMARTSAPHSATAQFFINHADNGFLDYPGQDGWGYCVFGKVLEGMDVVDKIATVPTGPGGPFRKDVPKTTVMIEKVTRLQ